MPKVKRQVNVNSAYYWEGAVIRERRVDVAWRDLTRPEKISIVKRRFLGSLAAATAVTLLVGQPGEAVSRQDGADNIRNQAIDYYRGLSVIDKYETSYLRPKTFETVDGKGGSGLLSFHGTYYASLGQKCLAGSAYDTQPSIITNGHSGGQISAVASLSMQGGNVVVTPYGGASGLSVLVFTVNNGELIPNTATADTLSANRCLVEDGVSMTEPIDYSGTSEDPQTYKLIPAIRPQDLS